MSLVTEERQYFKSACGLFDPLVSDRETAISHSFCKHVVGSGTALIVEDAREHPLLHDNPAVSEFGIVSYLGVPLATPDGHVIGSLCVFDNKPRTWAECDVQLLTDLAAGAATEIRLRMQTEEFARHKAVLELIAVGQPLHVILGELARAVEGTVEGALCCVLLADADGHRLRTGAAPSLPHGYMQATDGIAIGPSAGSCGTAAYLKHAVAVRDISTDPLWVDHREAAGQFGLCACWSVPIIGADGAVLGTFALYQREPWSPTCQHERIVADAVHIATVAIEKKRAEGVARASEERYRRLVEMSPDGIIVHRHGKIVFANQAAAQLMGAVDPTSLIGLPPLDFVHPTLKTAVVDRIRAMSAGSQAPVVELQVTSLDGRHGEVEVVSMPFVFAGEAAVQTVFRDISKRKQLEAQLRQAQKMEAVGQLAGGVAHDFNNLLTVIGGNSDFLRESMAADDPRHGDIDEIQQAASRAGSLTRQLLAFSRKQLLKPVALNLNTMVADVERMLRRLIGEDIVVETNLDPLLGNVMADPGQLEQVLINLAVNARDAMPNGGKLLIETSDVVLDGRYVASHPGAVGGRYVQVSMTDTGSGMDAATRARVFEPFFTTKETGKGTGLGLSTAYGIVKQSGGYIWVDAEPGCGSTFNVFIPRVDGPAVVESPQVAPAAPRGSETVLVVEDEPAVRNLAWRMLTRQGYFVLSAQSGAEGLSVAQQFEGPIDLLISDAVMPGMGGAELVRELARIRPKTKVLYMSGYTDDEMIRRGILEPNVAFLPKPFTAAEFSRKVRDVLDTR